MIMMSVFMVVLIVGVFGAIDAGVRPSKLKVVAGGLPGL
jgi:hypothetical protein